MLNRKKIYNKLPLGSTLVKVDNLIYLVGKSGLNKDEEKYLRDLGFEIQQNLNGKAVLNDGNMIKVVVTNDAHGILQEIPIFDSSDTQVEITVNSIKEQMNNTEALDIYEALAFVRGKELYITRVAKQVVDSSTGMVNTYQNYYFSKQTNNTEIEVDEDVAF